MAGNIELVPTIESGLNVVVQSGLNVVVQSGIQVRPESGAHVIIQSGISVMGTMGVSGQPVALVSGTQVGLSGLQVIIQSGVNIIGNITTTADISGQSVFVQPVSGYWLGLSDTTILATGAEQDLVNNTAAGYYWGWISLSNMQAGDTVVLREYIRSNGTYFLYADKSYSGVQADPLIVVRPKPITTGYRFTLQQTVGAARNFNYSFNLGAGYA